jgi:D-alanyl-D-alanine carboxypeptidase
MNNTNYSNPHGLMNRTNKSTAYDIGLLVCEALKNKDFCKIVAT